LSACLAESQFQRCAAQQTLHFWAMVLLGGHLFEQNKKSATTFFKPGRYKSCTLNSEINTKWRCCLGEIGVVLK
jgi:hypothetical protein